MSTQIEALKLKFANLMSGISASIDTKLDKTAAAVSADKLTNPFTLSFTGDATGTKSVPGNAAVSVALTLANTAVAPGIYPKVTVDSKGRVTKGELLIAADIPALEISKITGLSDSLATKVENTDVRLTNSREWVASTITQAEAEAGTSTTRRAWTAERVRQAIASWWNSSSEKTKLDGIEAGAQVNVATNLSYTTATTTGTVVSSTGTNATLPAATTAAAGLLTSADKSKLDGIQAGAQVNVATNLSWSASATAGTVSSSTGANAAIAAATTALAGLMTAADKSKLDGVAAGATVNSSDAVLINRANHTGTQAISTVSGLQAALDAKFSTGGGTVTGITTFGNTSNATSATSGAVRISGGLGVALDIYAAGNITAYSDIRLKDNIRVIDNPLERIHGVRGVIYRRKDSGQIQAGFIAQEMYKVLPEVVSKGEPDGYMGISYGNVTALLAEGIKELHGIVVDQGNQIDALSQRVDILTALFQELQTQVAQSPAGQ